MTPHSVTADPAQREQIDRVAARGGAPLAQALRHGAETLFRQELGDVRVHRGPEVTRLNHELRARAFSSGANVFLPEARGASERQLLMHELSHVAEARADRSHRGGSLVQRAPADTPAVSPEREELRGALIWLSTQAGSYAAAAGKRDVNDSEVSTRLVSYRAVLERAEAVAFGALPEASSELSQSYGALRAQFNAAVDALLRASAVSTGRTREQLYLAHERELPEWAMLRLDNPRFSTPLPVDATASDSGASMSVGELSVVFVADTSLPAGVRIPGSPQSSGQTSFRFAPRPGYSYQPNPDGTIKEFRFTAPFRPEVTITTTYVAGADPHARSAYGRGTTREDVAAGTRSLRFHEGSHGTDYVRYIREHPYPAFPSAVGLTPRQLTAAIRAYDEAVTRYRLEMEAFSRTRTDCVGEEAGFCAP